MIDISVVIPCYEMFGYGIEMLNHSLTILKEQTFKNFEVIISDDSKNNGIEILCSLWKEELNIQYYKNPGEPGLSSNINNAIINANGKIIKILCQDDFLFNSKSLENTINNFSFENKWLASSYYCTDLERKNILRYYVPTWNDKIYLINTLGTHSCISFLNTKNYYISFDTKLSWYMDCEFYYKLFLRYGKPKIINIPIVVQCIWKGQATNTLITDELVKNEEKYILEKYGNNTGLL